MKILFIHQNFPGQYKHLAPALVSQGHECVALTLRVKQTTQWEGVRVLPYAVKRNHGQMVHPWLVDLDTKVTRADACFRAALSLRDSGFTPDLILAHPGWGESLFLRDVWPEAKLAIYCELYHLPDYPHVGFDPEFERPADESEPLRIRMKNLNNELHFLSADAGISPTRFQADTFPAPFRDRITVVHDGINTDQAAPNPNVRLTIQSNAGTIELSRDNEVITFVNRNLEPYRGYHRFMRALPRILRDRPAARILIVGGDEVSYGAAAPKGQTWKQIYIDEVRGQIPDEDWARVHFLGRISYDLFLQLLQISRAHVYLTYPFVLSWSLMEAMSCEAAIIASDTGPVREVIEHDKNGRLVDFFDTDALISELYTVLDDADLRQRLGRAARELMVSQYDLERVCLPRQLAWIDAVMKS